MDKKSGGGFAEHDGEFCDCGGNGSCEKWAWAGEMADQKACEAKANKLGASCFDYNGPRMYESDVDLAPPAGNISGPVGEVWVTHTELDRHKFGVAMAAMLRNDYTLSLGEQPLPLPSLPRLQGARCRTAHGVACCCGRPENTECVTCSHGHGLESRQVRAL